MKKLTRFVFVLMLSVNFVSAQQTPPAQTSGASDGLKQEAGDFYQKQDWPKAAAAYEKIVRADEKDVGARYRLGVSLFNLGKAEAARTEFEKVFTASPNPVFALALARAYARTGEKEKAFETIEKSTTLGGIAPEALTAEKEFAAFRDEARFRELVRKSDLAVNPCKARPEFRQFDFWIGEWNVKNTQGLPVGQSSVQLILGDCIIFENWSSGAGSNGKSFNIFDTTDGKWHQTWVSDKGVFTHYIGESSGDGRLVYIADTVFNGQKGKLRMTFTRLDGGDVRQHGESSSDDGKTWQTRYDLIYSRKK